MLTVVIVSVFFNGIALIAAVSWFLNYLEKLNKKYGEDE